MHKPYLLATLILTWLVPPAALADTALSFTYDGRSYAGQSLPPAVQQQLYDIEVETRTRQKQAVDEYVLNRYLRETAAAENISIRELQNKLFSVANPTDAQLRAFYDANKSRIQGSYEEVRGQLGQFLQNQFRAQKQADLLTLIGTEKEYAVKLPEPQAPRFAIDIDGHPSKGSAEAELVLVEFADYQCPHCKDAVAAVEQVLQRYGKSLRVVFRDFPINPSGISRQVAKGAYCAGRQDRFWDYHDLAFERQDYLKVVTPSMLAAELDLDAEAFASCHGSEAAETHVARSTAEAEELGLNGTPAFFLNGERLHIHGDIQGDLSKAVEQALAGDS